MGTCSAWTPLSAAQTVAVFHNVLDRIDYDCGNLVYAVPSCTDNT